MPRVIATHGVGNMETWLAGGAERADIFKQFSSAYRIYRHPQDKKVAIVWENADLQRLACFRGELSAANRQARLDA